MKEIRFTVLLNEKESQMLDKLTYELKFGDNRSACVRYLLEDAYRQHIEKAKKGAK